MNHCHIGTLLLRRRTWRKLNARFALVKLSKDHHHSERSEESLIKSFFPALKENQRCFAALNMTNAGTLQRFNTSTIIIQRAPEIPGRN
jgi:hypothetical protein